MADQKSRNDPFGFTFCIATGAVICIAVFRALGIGSAIGGALGGLLGFFLGSTVYKLMAANKR